MKQLRRWLLNCAAFMSFLLCTATIAIAIRSYWAGYKFNYNRVSARDSVIFIANRTLLMGKGGLGYLCDEYRYGTLTQGEKLRAGNGFNKVEVTFQNPPSYPDLNSKTALGFSFGYGPGWMQVIAPIWSLVLLTMILPTTAVARSWRSLQKAREGHCRICGYDLRATPDKCPECGTVPEAIAKGAI